MDLGECLNFIWSGGTCTRSNAQVEEKRHLVTILVARNPSSHRPKIKVTPVNAT
jgi:hypothetical protein